MKTYRIISFRPAFPSQKTKEHYKGLFIDDAKYFLNQEYHQLNYCAGIGGISWDSPIPEDRMEFYIENTSGEIDTIYKIEEE